jgi:hypothetical protein
VVDLAGLIHLIDPTPFKTTFVDNIDLIDSHAEDVIVDFFDLFAHNNQFYLIVLDILRDNPGKNNIVNQMGALLTDSLSQSISGDDGTFSGSEVKLIKTLIRDYLDFDFVTSYDFLSTIGEGPTSVFLEVIDNPNLPSLLESKNLNVASLLVGGFSSGKFSYIMNSGSQIREWEDALDICDVYYNFYRFLKIVETRGYRLLVSLGDLVNKFYGGVYDTLESRQDDLLYFNSTLLFGAMYHCNLNKDVVGYEYYKSFLTDDMRGIILSEHLTAQGKENVAESVLIDIFSGFETVNEYIKNALVHQSLQGDIGYPTLSAMIVNDPRFEIPPISEEFYDLDTKYRNLLIKSDPESTGRFGIDVFNTDKVIEFLERSGFPREKFIEYLKENIDMPTDFISRNDVSQIYSIYYLYEYKNSMSDRKLHSGKFMFRALDNFPRIRYEILYNDFGRYGGIINDLNVVGQIMFLYRNTDFLQKYKLLRPHTYLAYCVYTMMYRFPESFVWDSDYKDFMIMFGGDHLKEFTSMLKGYQEDPEKVKVINKTCEAYPEIKKLTLLAELSLLN